MTGSFGVTSKTTEQNLIVRIGKSQAEVTNNKFFTVRVDDARRGHRYKLYLPGCKSAARYNFFSYRVVRAWNTIPAGKK